MVPRAATVRRAAWPVPAGRPVSRSSGGWRGALLVRSGLPGCLDVEVTDGPLDFLITLALRALGHAAIVLVDAHVRRELPAAPLAEELVVGHGRDLRELSAPGLGG